MPRNLYICFICFQFSSKSMCRLVLTTAPGIGHQPVNPAQALIDFAYGIQNNSPLSYQTG